MTEATRTATNLIKLDSLFQHLNGQVKQSDRELIERAFEFANLAHEGQVRASGEPYIQHCLAVAKILADLHMDAQSIAAALLHDVVEDTGFTVDELCQEFGDEVASLVDGVTKLDQIDQISLGERRQPQDPDTESLRKMFLAMVEDVRVVLIKLADRLHNMRTLGSLSEIRRRRIAQETLDIFAPLANRLGIWQMKWELEDLGLRYLDPVRYKEIAAQIAERRPEREQALGRVVSSIQEQLQAHGIEAEISARPKHIYSIWKKMERKQLPFEQIYDVRALRVIVKDLATCYQVLGIVHGLWRPIPGEFDDYIAAPKDNLYQSLHTAVVADDGKTLEVQIRTPDMHHAAEYGIAAHWRYKEGSRRDVDFENKISWLRSLMEWRQEVSDAKEFVDSLKTDVFRDRVYVFTPKGQVIDLPTGATPIDFAYHVHTEIGDRCRGAKVNGVLVNLQYQLKTGDQVEILTAKRGGPSRDWLNPQLGYVVSQRARSKIRQWFKRQDREKNIQQGREMLDRELKRLGVKAVNLDQLARMFEYDKLEDFLSAFGCGDIGPQQISNRVLSIESATHPAPSSVIDEAPGLADKLSVEPPSAPAISVDGMTIRGTGGFLTHLARCCNPLPEDEIIGYITRGRGVTIHRRDCPNVLMIQDRERLIEVNWGQAQQTYPVMVKITAYDRGGLLHDISGVVSGEKINISSVNVSTHKGIATLFCTFQITSITQLSRVLVKLEQIPNVIEARRQTD